MNDGYVIRPVTGDELVAAVAESLGQLTIELKPMTVYTLSAPLDLSSNVGSFGIKLRGNLATLTPGSDFGTEPMVKVNTEVPEHLIGGLELRDLVLDCAGQAGGISLHLAGLPSSIISRVRVLSFKGVGWYITKCQAARFEGCESDLGNGDGWIIEDANGCRFEQCRSWTNTGNGMIVRANEFSGGCNLRNIIIEGNNGDGIHIDGTISPVTLESGWLEGNQGDGITVFGGARGAMISNMTIIGGDAGDVTRAIRFGSDTAGGLARDNRLVASAGTGAYARIVDEAPKGANDIVGNRHRSDGTRVIVEAYGQGLAEERFGGEFSYVDGTVELFSVGLGHQDTATISVMIGGSAPPWSTYVASKILTAVGFAGTDIEVDESELVIAFTGTSPIPNITPVVVGGNRLSIRYSQDNPNTIAGTLFWHAIVWGKTGTIL